MATLKKKGKSRRLNKKCAQSLFKWPHFYALDLCINTSLGRRRKRKRRGGENSQIRSLFFLMPGGFSDDEEKRFFCCKKRELLLLLLPFRVWLFSFNVLGFYGVLVVVNHSAPKALKAKKRHISSEERRNSHL